MTTWNYRVFKKTLDHGECEYTIRECYYADDGSITGYTGATQPYGTSFDELRGDIEKFTQALSRPVVELDETGE